MIFIIFECRKFHKNATYLLASMYVSWFECFLATLIILPYKYGIINLAEPTQIFEGFEDLDNYLQLEELNLKSIPVLIAGFLFWHYLAVVNSGFCVFLIERTVATVLFNDYESKNRPKLTISIVVVHQIYALFLAIIPFFHMVSFRDFLGSNAFSMFIIIPHLLILKYYNTQRRKNMKLAKNIAKNSLAAKFQTEENVRSITLAFRIFSIVILFNLVFLTIIYLGIAKVPGEKYYFQVAEHMIFFGPIVLVPAMISSEKDWKNRFLEKLRIKKSLKILPEVSGRTQDTTDEYFKQLRSAWA
ncbi:hypothetical protein B9Z55_021366 [Caenorhabditis nigoni]|nr:hypothetical protein B9Z55_021366 [Caenorhabditis nigoni]